MPFSTTPPPIVLPDSSEGREYRDRHVAGAVHSRLCDEYRRDRSPIYTDMDVLTPLPLCANRSREGDRRFSWCYRCMAGFPSIGLDERDAQGHRDSLTV